MRNISFALTTKQILAQTKTVTRRLGWKFLKPGDYLCGVEKSQGLKPGEKLVRLNVIRVISVAREMLQEIAELDAKDECRKEGFPEMHPDVFIEMFCEHMGCTPTTWVTRIEFAYVTLEEWCDLVDKDENLRAWKWKQKCGGGG